MVKRLWIISALFVFTLTSATAQTNTFPSSGNVGIGTTTPTSKLYVGGAGPATGGSGTHIASIPTWDSSAITGWAQGYDSWFSLGGTSTAGTVNGYLANGGATNSASLSNFQAFYSSQWPSGMVTNNYGFRASGTAGTNNFGVYIDEAKSFFNGNVGISTTSPATKLDIYNGGIRLSGASPSFGGGSDSGIIGAGGASGNLQLITAGNIVTTINSFGNVGIGTTSPAGSLHIVSPSVQSNSPGTGIFLGKSLGDDYQLQLTQPGGTPHIDLSRGTNPDFDARIAAPADNQLSLGTASGGYVLNIISGNVGIGTTSPGGSLDISRGSAPGGTAVFRGTNNYSHFNYSATEDTYIRGGKIGSVVHINDAAIGNVLLAENGGNVGIGTINPSHKLAVNGTVRAKEVIVDTGWADYVFKKGYRLAPLTEVEAHIEREGHLPGIPSAAEVAEHGVSMGEMQAKLLAKVEELTLHMIAQEKRLSAQETQIGTQAGRIQQLEAENAALRTSHRH